MINLRFPHNATYLNHQWCSSAKPSPAALIRAPWNLFESCISCQNKKEAVGLPFIIGADDRTRTCTLARWNLNPMSLPIPPHPRIQLQIMNYKFTMASDFYTGRYPGWGIVPDPHIKNRRTCFFSVNQSSERNATTNHTADRPQSIIASVLFVFQ